MIAPSNLLTTRQLSPEISFCCACLCEQLTTCRHLGMLFTSPVVTVLPYRKANSFRIPEQVQLGSVWLVWDLEMGILLQCFLEQNYFGCHLNQTDVVLASLYWKYSINILTYLTLFLEGHISCFLLLIFVYFLYTETCFDMESVILSPTSNACIEMFVSKGTL